MTAAAPGGPELAVRPARPEDSLAIARLYARSAPFRRAFGAHREEGARALADDFVGMGMEGLFVADGGGQLAGAMQLIPDVRAFREREGQLSPRPFFRHLGIPGALRALAVLVLGTRASPSVELPSAVFANFLAVSPERGGFPAAVALMLHARQHVRSLGRTWIVGWISSDNRLACEFFLRLFPSHEVVERRRSLLSRLLLGVPAWNLVLLDVREGGRRSSRDLRRTLALVTGAERGKGLSLRGLFWTGKACE